MLSDENIRRLGRSVLLCTVVVAACCALVGAQNAPGKAQSPAVLEYLGDRATRMAAALPGPPADRQAWEKRREQVREDFAKVLGLPKRLPMKARVEKSVQDGGLVVEDVAYLWDERAYVSANVVRLKDAKARSPGIVVPPGWVGSLQQGLYKTFVYHMARKGYVMLFIDDPRVGKRQAVYSGLYGVASAAGTPTMGVQVFDTLRGLDYMLTRADVDPGRIGVCGLCQGSEQTWLAAGLEDRFKVAAPVCGTTTYEGWVRMPFFLKVGLSDPSPYIDNVLRYTDWNEIGACIAPRPVLIASNSGDNWWPKAGFDKVVATLKKTYALYQADERFKVVWDLRSHDMAPFIPELEAWFEKYLKPLPASGAAPLPCEEPLDPDFNMIRYFQRRIAQQAAKVPKTFDSPDAWQAYRKDILQWLRGACAVDELKHAKPSLCSSRTADGVTVEVVDLPQDGAFCCPAAIYSPLARSEVPRPAVILSLHSTACMSDAAVVAIARRLANAGFIVMLPEHASYSRSSRRYVTSPGDNFISLYGAGDTVGLPPLAMRVWDDLSCVEYLSNRDGVDRRKILLVGTDIGGVDAVLAAAMDDRAAGAASLGAITAEDWANHVAPTQHLFDRIMPYLPSLATRTDLQCFYAAVAPRPLLLVETPGRPGWPESAFQRVSAEARCVYDLTQSGKSLLRVRAQDCTDALAGRLDNEIQKHLVAVAGALLPPAPIPGQVGTKEGLKSRANVDATAGIVWVLKGLGGLAQEFTQDRLRLKSWGFFGDDADCRGRKITPLVFKKEGDGFKLTGIGTTRTNAANGPQVHDFGTVAGSDAVGKGYCFGWYTGDPAGGINAGVEEYDDNTADAATVLTLDGQTGGQKAILGKVYAVKFHLPRTYSIWAQAETAKK